MQGRRVQYILWVGKNKTWICKEGKVIDNVGYVQYYTV